jgi:hypothetical protein
MADLDRGVEKFHLSEILLLDNAGGYDKVALGLVYQSFRGNFIDERQIFLRHWTTSEEDSILWLNEA